MKEYLFGIIGYLIFSSVVIHILPGNEYVRYFRVINGIILFLMIIRPVVQADMIDERMILKMFDIGRTIEIDNNLIEKTEKLGNEKTERQIAECVRLRLEEENIITRNVNVNISDNDIKNVYVELKLSYKDRKKEAKILISKYLGIVQEHIEVN